MIRLLAITIVIALIWTACGKKTGNLDGNDSVAQCLLSKDYQYEYLLTKADITKHISVDEESFKADVSATKGPYGYAGYQWDSNRPNLVIEILGQTINQPDKNRVKLTSLSFYTDSELKLYQQADALALFDQSYKKLSQEEYNGLLANLEKQYADNPAGLEQAKGFLDARMNFTYVPVESLGDRAYWKWHEVYGIELVVLSGAARFAIETRVSADANSSLDAAVKFAKEVLAKCGG